MTVQHVEFSLTQIIRAVLKRRLTLIAVIVLATVTSSAYALLATEWYRSSVLVSPNVGSDLSGGLSQLGLVSGLANIAGIGGASKDSVEAMAIMQSRHFVANFIEENSLMPLLFAESWDKQKQRWLIDDPGKTPDIREGVKIFLEEILSVQEDAQSGLVTITMHWKDPDIAMQWASKYVDRINAVTRARALDQSKTNIAYLESQLETATVSILRESIASLLEKEFQKEMIARGDTEFAFRVIDPASVPLKRYKPRRTLIVIAGNFVAGTLFIFFVWMRELTLLKEERVGTGKSLV